MTFVPFPENPPKDPELEKVFAAFSNRHGFVDHILWVHAHNPRTLKGHVELYRALMFGPSPLSRKQRETIAVVASAANRCHY